MKINFIGNFNTGFVGEVADEIILTREMESLGHTVYRVPRDIWREYCRGDWNDSWKEKMPIANADINIICKWNAFDSRIYIEKLKELTSAPCFYFVWDYMCDEPWHLEMVNASDLYLGNDVFSGKYNNFKNCYYFPFDVADGEFPKMFIPDKKYDVVFFGSCIGQGDRIAWLKEINKTHKVICFGWNHEGWIREGLEAYPPVYGLDFVRKVAETKICLGFSVNQNCWGYWSNRTGKILTLGGFLLYQYAPGMELFLRDGVEYFSSIEEASQKIGYYLEHEDERYEVAKRGLAMGRDRFTSQARIKDLMILAERFIKTKGEGWCF